VSQLRPLQYRIAGIYVNLFLVSIYTLSRRRETPGINVLIAASCVMAVVATTQMAVNIAGTVITARFVQQLVHVKVLSRPQSVRTLETVENVLLAINKWVNKLH
jgi:Na+/proline symporter